MQKCNKTFSVSLMVCFILSFTIPTLSWAQLRGDTYAAAKSKKKAELTLAYAYTPGLVYKDDEGRMKGVCVDIMKAYANYLMEVEGISVKFNYHGSHANNFTGLLSTVKSARGGVFGLSNTTITKGRKLHYNFSSPFITNMALLITHKSIPTLEDIEGIPTVFKGMSAVAVKNSTNAMHLLDIKKKYLPSMKIDYVNSFMEAMQIVEKDPTKFTNQDLNYFFDAVRKSSPLKRHPGGDTHREYFGIIMPKSNDWTPSLNKFLSSYVGSNEYKKVITNHLGISAVKFMDSLK